MTVDVGVGSPIPVDAFVSGEWPDLCAQLAQITQRFEGNTFEITLLATAADPACPPDYLGLPFRIAIPINVVQLPEGAVHGHRQRRDDHLHRPRDLAGQPAAGRDTALAAREATVEMPATCAGRDCAATATRSRATAAGRRALPGPQSLPGHAAFDVAYDPAVWEYVEDDGSGRQSQLKHRSLPGCAVWLRAGPVGATQMATVWRAEREWTISQVQSNIIQYSSAQGDISWIFGVLLPEAYSGRGNSNCQDAAEQVIDTFKVLPQ